MFIGLLEFVGFIEFKNPRVSLSPFLLIYLFLSSVLGHLPDNALGSELAIEFWIDTLAAMVDIETLAALPTKPCFMFLTDSDRLPVRMISTLHVVFARLRSRLILS